MKKSSKRKLSSLKGFVLVFTLSSFVLLVLGLLVFYFYHVNKPLVEVLHLPNTYSRRHGDFKINICGKKSPLLKRFRYKINDHSWQRVQKNRKRTPGNFFTIEINPDQVSEGYNVLHLEAKEILKSEPEIISYDFHYDPSPITLPLHIDWKDRELQVEDGWWESFEENGQWRVRPVRGSEGYDRILVATGAFEAPRRIITDVIFRKPIRGRRGQRFNHAFGLLSLWGGHPDKPSEQLGRGWNFCLAWYWDKYKGVGSEFSYKFGKENSKWVNSYVNLRLIPDTKYIIKADVWSVKDQEGKHRCYKQRLKWWRHDQNEPEYWIELADIEGAPLPEAEYGIAFVSYFAAVDFGPVEVLPLDLNDINSN